MDHVAGVGGTGARATSATLDEVARLAGVSRATASRAVNGGERVSARSRAAVEAAVRSLGYTPNPAARSLVTRRTDSVAVVVPEPDERVFADPFFARTLRGVTEVLADKDLQLVLLLARPGDAEERMLRYLRRRHVDGAIVVSHHRSGSLAEHLADLRLPCVFVGRPWTGADRVSYVDTDNVAGGRQATQVLIERGCRRIGTIAGTADMTAGADRLAGWRSALRDAGLDDSGIEHGNFTEDGGETATRRLLSAHPDLDGLMVASDLMALGAVKALAHAGRRIPHDVAIVGYDDVGLAERTAPPLTTMRNPIREMAEQATRLLLEQIDSDRPTHPMRVIFPPTLIQRESA